MNLINEIKKCVAFADGYSVTADARGGYVRGVKRICSATDDCVALETSCAFISVCGKKLTISKLVDGDVGVAGSICNVEIKAK